MTNPDRRNDVLLYAAGLLDAEERVEVAAYLERGGPRAAGELAEAEATLEHLAVSLRPLAPPVRIQERLVARVAAARTPARLRAIRGGGVPEPPRARPSGARVALASAAAVLAAYLAVELTTAERPYDPEQVPTRSSAPPPVLVASTAAPHEIVHSQAPEVKVIELEGPALGRHGSGRVYQNWQTGDCYLYVRGLLPPESGYDYQVWFTTMDGGAAAGGLLWPDASGDAAFLTRMPRDVDVGAPVLVTLERAGWVGAPQGAPQLVGELRL